MRLALVLFAVLVECPCGMESSAISIAQGDFARMLVIKVGGLFVILLPLLLFVWMNRVRALVYFSTHVLIVALIVATNMAFCLLVLDWGL